MSDEGRPPASTEPTSARLVAFCEPGVREVFEAVVGPTQVWQEDPYDVETIHNDARDEFARLISRATTVPPPVDRGRVLLLRGDAGSGKTHLMRAFRSSSHRDGSAHFAYLQLTSAAANYGQYMLANVVASLEHPYAPPTVAETGLQRLSNALLDAVPGLTDGERAALRGDADDEGAEPVHVLFTAAERIAADARFAGCDEDLIRAVLFLQRDDPRVRTKVAKWLRGEEMNGYDRSLIGDLVPRSRPEQATELIAQLARLIAVAQNAALVLCLDQLEDVGHMDGAANRFRQIVNELVAFADAVPTGIVVLSCLDDYYTLVRDHLPGAKLDRIEANPPPIRLAGARSLPEVEAMVGRRLGCLYEESGLTAEPGSTYPFRREHLAPLANLNTRQVLERCRQHHLLCVVEQGWVDPAWDGAAAVDTMPAVAVLPGVNLDQLWNDAVHSAGITVPETERGLAELLGASAARATAELADPYRLTTQQDGNLLSVEEHSPEGQARRLLVAVCEKSARGGGLGKQVAAVAAAAAGRPVVLVRSTAFPVDARAIVSKQIGKLIGTTGRRVEVSNSDWRAMVAFATFAAAHAASPGFAQWERSSRPLSQLRALQRILDLKPLAEPRVQAKVGSAPKPEPVPRPTVTPAIPPAPVESPTPAELRLGRTRAVVPEPVVIHTEELKQHMVFIGGNGTGKTTAALRLIEQLLARGVPAVLIDRKGDLARYADPAAWDVTDPPATAHYGPRRQALREGLDVALYTPGSGDRGRPLSLPVFPDGLSEATETERGELARFAADALGGMMGLDAKRQGDRTLLAILAKAIEVMAQATPAGQAVSVDQVRGLIAGQEDTLLNAVGGLDGRHYRKLAELMLTMSINHAGLLAVGGGDLLDVDRLLGPSGAVPGRGRLTVINTQALGSDAAVQFWLSRFLFAVDRWRARSPSPTLQAVLFMDEADQYLPATSRPPTKAPLESLLKRARSAGLGIMLATQSPGDLDYKGRDNIRNWLVGRVQEPVGIAKLKPMFGGSPVDVAGKLPQQSPGEFYLLRDGKVTSVRAGRSLISTQQMSDDEIVTLAARRAGIRG